ncbi:antitoxin Xre-like helix-turn-helix domain-containing protein [Accumulibacter sp.]|uniref:antitoxin Xre-like helix-turn-helix domain-containing protein n=1 Tax=Accumulibacter sp. TaxID=2053492 RepID=UPI0025DC5E49|nr:antitoxin Xre-like helix-turn-helix domain-containing protein [Accumulibacter sp.]MCM8611768.1 MbcA/ParS/Xre antitoxin family protein [Accumulibacter sp.]MCM8635641.1 MbcA/ParS/Xre antitoxin family protein [Accumulibacter sp.]MCM8639228.1 MbcA/ParS/Xre antitoxin family protein [Accumulibacter sp.]
MPGTSLHTASSAEPAAVLSKAVTRAADHLHIQRSLLARVLGISAATVSRLYSGAYQLDQRRKEWELAILFVRAFRSLDSIVGEQEAACRWLGSNNRGLNGRPLDLITQTEGLVRVVHYLDASRSLV